MELRTHHVVHGNRDPILEGFRGDFDLKVPQPAFQSILIRMRTIGWFVVICFCRGRSRRRTNRLHGVVVVNQGRRRRSSSSSIGG